MKKKCSRDSRICLSKRLLLELKFTAFLILFTAVISNGGAVANQTYAQQGNRVSIARSTSRGPNGNSGKLAGGIDWHRRSCCHWVWKHKKRRCD